VSSSAPHRPLTQYTRSHFTKRA